MRGVAFSLKDGLLMLLNALVVLVIKLLQHARQSPEFIIDRPLAKVLVCGPWIVHVCLVVPQISRTSLLHDPLTDDV